MLVLIGEPILGERCLLGERDWSTRPFPALTFLRRHPLEANILVCSRSSH
jgi:hypothetical protein